MDRRSFLRTLLALPVLALAPLCAKPAAPSVLSEEAFWNAKDSIRAHYAGLDGEPFTQRFIVDAYAPRGTVWLIDPARVYVAHRFVFLPAALLFESELRETPYGRWVERA